VHELKQPTPTWLRAKPWDLMDSIGECFLQVWADRLAWIQLAASHAEPNQPKPQLRAVSLLVAEDSLKVDVRYEACIDCVYTDFSQEPIQQEHTQCLSCYQLSLPCSCFPPSH
jgi:hypothetical protein